MRKSTQRILKALGKTKSLEDVKKMQSFAIDGHKLFLSKIEAQKSQERAKGMKNYMKSNLQFYGLPTPTIRKICSEQIQKDQDFENNFLLSENLIKSNIFELKLLGIDILTKCFQKIDTKVLQIIREIIQQGHIEGWALVDSLSLPIKLSSVKHGQQFDDHLFKWQFQKHNTWVRRAAIVAFVKRASHGDNKPNYKGFMKKLFSLCQQCVQYDNRFNQLAIGWLLRQMNKTDNKGVVEFIYKHYNTMSRQGIRYAIEKMEQTERKKILNYKNELTSISKQKIK